MSARKSKLTRRKNRCRTLRVSSRLRQKKQKPEDVADGEARGRADGEARGRADGEANGLREGIALAIRLKFGETGRELIREISQINALPTLRRVTASIEGAATVDDVRRLLGQS